MTDIPATLEAVRALTAPSRDVADDVLRCFGWQKNDLTWEWYDPNGESVGDDPNNRPDPTTSVDAAKALMPEGYRIAVTTKVDGSARVSAFHDHTGWFCEAIAAFNEATARTAAALAALMAQQAGADRKQAAETKAKNRRSVLRTLAKELVADGMRCNCDLDTWEPDLLTGHSHVCRVHKAALAAEIERTK